jgi:hypothetical protein
MSIILRTKRNVRKEDPNVIINSVELSSTLYTLETLIARLDECVSQHATTELITESNQVFRFDPERYAAFSILEKA